MAGRGYSGRNVLLDLKVEYEYQNVVRDEYGGYISGGLLKEFELRLSHINGRNLSEFVTDFDEIADDMKKLARAFLDKNIYERPQHPKAPLRTHELYESVEALPIGDSIILKAPARDYKGRAYAGHIEYGFTLRDGRPRGPWPFLRPAARLAAARSTGPIGENLSQYLRDVLAGEETLEFGRYPNDKDNVDKLASTVRNRLGGGNKGWAKANHGIRKKKDSYFYHETNDYDWNAGLVTR